MMELWQILLALGGLIGAVAALYLLVDLIIRASIIAWVVKTIAKMLNPFGF